VSKYSVVTIVLNPNASVQTPIENLTYKDARRLFHSKVKSARKEYGYSIKIMHDTFTVVCEFKQDRM
jgi:hypothetical protein